MYRLLQYQNLMVTANQKSTVDTLTKKKKESKHNTKLNDQITRGQKRKGRKKTYKNNSKTINEMALRTYTCVSTKSLQLCPTLRDPMDCSLPGSSVRRILQARILE